MNIKNMKVNAYKIKWVERLHTNVVRSSAQNCLFSSSPITVIALPHTRIINIRFFLLVVIFATAIIIPNIVREYSCLDKLSPRLETVQDNGVRLSYYFSRECSFCERILESLHG